MTSKIQVPEHIAKELEAEQNPPKEETKIPYVKEEARVLDPTLIDKSILERMPQPTGWRILILPYAGKGVTDGGIQLVQSTVDQQRLSTVVGYVVKMGQTLQQTTFDESATRLESQKAQAMASLQKAHEVADYEKVAQAQDVLAKIAVQEQKVQEGKIRMEQMQKETPVQQPQATVQQQPMFNSKMQNWIDS
jgi:hypothetical protein